ncbi:butyrate kinase [Clostridiaceae bacterium HSG29]|nr:butyrate kinase [Clostridiaceae bacterium HSG29]
MNYILTINPGSTSTKVAIFKGKENVLQKNLDHSSEELDKFEEITDQYEYRKDIILDWVKGENYDLSQFKAIVGRGGLLKPMPSGTYEVTDEMVKDLKIGIQGKHASNLGGLLAKAIGDEVDIPSFIVDPVAVDEFDDIARISGMPDVERKSLLHALNVKAIAYRVANEKNTKVEDLSLVIAHLGGGISIVPLKDGRMIDANNANEMGPFSPERAGGLPVGDIMKMCYSGEYTFKTLKPKLRGKAGLVAYTGTNDVREVIKLIENGNEDAKMALDAMSYQIAKEIGKMATVLKGNVDAIVLTGGVAYSKYVTDYITKHVEFISEVIVKPGEDEMIALNEGALRVIEGPEVAKIYENEVE